MFSFFGGGLGGSAASDGLNHGNAPISTATIPPVEILEAAYPVAFTQWALRPDSAGAGEHRGGLGAVYEIELLEEQADLFLFGERGRFPPQGVRGGAAGALNRFGYQQDDGWHAPPLVSKTTGIRLRRGQRVRLETPGGGGYGPPGRRDRAAVARDLRLGYVTRERAAADYGDLPDAAG
jgi:N-methylhydantoinase B